jgi:hypothetical protein
LENRIGIVRVRRWAIGIVVMVVDGFRHRGAAVRVSEEEVRHTEEVEVVDVEVRDQGEAGVEVEVEATEIAMMIGKAIGHGAIRAADRRRRDVEVGV